MSLMLKLSTIAALLITSSVAQEEALTSFLQKGIGANPNVKEVHVSVKSAQPLKNVAGWRGVIVELNGVARTPKGETPFKEQGIYFTNGTVMAPDLVDMSTGASMKESVTPKLDAKVYNSANLISGSADAKHKMVIFSDPLCPYCQRSVPGIIEYVQKYPKTFALYYYHLPLASIHPASVTLTKAMLVAQEMGKNSAIMKAYKSGVSGRESDDAKILAGFNKATGLNVTLADTKKPAIEKHAKADLDMASELMVNGTPTIFFDGRKDNSRSQYKSVKTVD